MTRSGCGRADRGSGRVTAARRGAGVTLQAVATAIGVPLNNFKVRAEGDLDFRRTLGVSKDAAVGFRSIRLAFELDCDAPPDKVAKLVELTERYCVVLQTLRNAPSIAVSTKASN